MERWGWGEDRGQPPSEGLPFTQVSAHGHLPREATNTPLSASATTCPVGPTGLCSPSSCTACNTGDAPKIFVRGRDGWHFPRAGRSPPRPCRPTTYQLRGSDPWKTPRPRACGLLAVSGFLFGPFVHPHAWHQACSGAGSAASWVCHWTGKRMMDWSVL